LFTKGIKIRPGTSGTFLSPEKRFPGERFEWRQRIRSCRTVGGREIFITEIEPTGNRMKDIVSTRKMENGIACYYGQAGREEMESFTYSELIDMKINALDLLEDPKNYGIDEKTRKVVMKK
jgi:hypothetical protein